MVGRSPRGVLGRRLGLLRRRGGRQPRGGARRRRGRHAGRALVSRHPAQLRRARPARAGQATTTSWPSPPSARTAPPARRPGRSCGPRSPRWPSGSARPASGRGDRVVGYLPDTTPALVAFLATASVGAIWSACAQDYGAAGAAARFAQLEPVVLFAADGYRWNGRVHDRRDEVTALQRALPTLRATVHVTNVGLPTRGRARARRPIRQRRDAAETATATPAELRFDRVDFDAPLWVLFSSGTTGLPKGIVHGHGGVLLEHYKLLGLHLDAGPDSPVFWYTTTNWIMWNIVASGLLVGAPIVLYDGSPGYPDAARLWQIAADQRVAMLGVSPGYLLACAKAGISPGRDLDLGRLRTLGSHRFAADRRVVLLGPGRGRPPGPGRVGERRHRRGQRVRRQRPDHRRLGGRDLRPQPRRRARGLGRRRASRSPARSASSSSPSRCRRCRCTSGTTPTARATATPTSPPSPASGGTATGWRSPNAAASSSPAGPTPPSTATASGSAAPTSTPWSTSSRSWPSRW